MSNAIFPTLAGVTWNILRSPTWSTQIRDAASGRQYTLGKRLYPLWHFKLAFEVLRSSGGFTEWQQLVGFINARRGRYDDFLYLDPRDNAATNEVFGVGDGVTTTFDLVRSLGGFIEPVGGAASVIAKVAGVTTAVTLSSNLAQATFAVAPAAAASLTWSGTFYFRARFMQDEISIEQFMQDMHTAKSVEFKTFRP